MEYPVLKIFFVIWLAMLALSFVEGYVEGRNPWHHRKLGWKIKLPGGYYYPAYHFFLFIPIIIVGWDLELFGILLSAYSTGLIIEDFFYFIVNPAVRFKEFFTDFTDYYPWVKIGNRKILPLGYPIGIFVSILSWYYLWS